MTGRGSNADGGRSASGSAPQLTATYRLQLHAGFTLRDAARIADYLHELGISHVYLSPILQARKGSTHGYDVVDPTRVNDELGGEEGRRALLQELRSRGMGMLLDIVPNHMGTGEENPFWQDVLRHGAASRYARWFDIAWRSDLPALRGRVLIPVLGDRLPRVLARGEITLEWTQGELRVRYFDHHFPTDPATIPIVLGGAFAGAARGRLASLLDSLRTLPPRSESQSSEGQRSRQAREILEEINALLAAAPNARRQLNAAIRKYSTGRDAPARLRAFLDAQPYRLAFWRRAAKVINYRRFFDINELAALRMEDASVFRDIHKLPLEWVQRDELKALRVDHVDGLLDPRGYLEMLRDAVAQRTAPGADCPIFVEKILSPGERLPCEWPVAGTTGYEFLNDLEAIFVDGEGQEQISRFYGRQVRAGEFRTAAYRGKVRVLDSSLMAEVRTLTRLATSPGTVRRAGAARGGRPSMGLRRAIVELIAALPVYRTYIDPRSGAASDTDRQHIDKALERATARGKVKPPLLRQLRATLLGEDRDGDSPERLKFVSRFQQITGPATAKGVEDTALYVHVPLASLNEVGGEPDRNVLQAAATLHEANSQRARQWPRSLTCTTTHDTKRTADARARLDALSHVAEEWIATCRRWMRNNASLKQSVRAGRLAPDRNTEYLLYQSVIAVWPVESDGSAMLPKGAALRELRERIDGYMLKAVREAKVNTSWTEPDEAFEKAVESFVAALLDSKRAESKRFMREAAGLVGRIAREAACLALARTLVHLTSPGIPDTYQGDELWNHALVDPDNRRPVDFDLRRDLLASFRSASSSGTAASASARPSLEKLARELGSMPCDPRTKLFLVWRVLAERRNTPELFTRGSYLGLEVSGDSKGAVFAFARTHEKQVALTLVRRRGFSGVEAGDGGPWLQNAAIMVPEGLSGRWRCAFTGRDVDLSGEVESGGKSAHRSLPVRELISAFPVSLLMSR